MSQVEITSRHVQCIDSWIDVYDGAIPPAVASAVTGLKATVDGVPYAWEGYRRLACGVCLADLAIVGEAPARRGEKPFAGDSGDRLARYMGVIPAALRVGPSLGPQLVNLYAEAPARWNKRRAQAMAVTRARRHALWLRPVVVLCGRRVAEAFGVADAQVFEYSRVELGLRYPVWCVRIPHPSKRNRWWTTADNRLEAAVFFAIMLGRVKL